MGEVTRVIGEDFAVIRMGDGDRAEPGVETTLSGDRGRGAGLWSLPPRVRG